MCNARFGLFNYCGWSVWNHWHKTAVQIRRAEHDGPDVLRSGFSAKFSAEASLGMWCLPCQLGRNHFENIVEFPGVEDQRVLCFVCCGCRVGRGCFLPVSSKQEPAAAAEEYWDLRPCVLFLHVCSTSSKAGKFDFREPYPKAYPERGQRNIPLRQTSR